MNESYLAGRGLDKIKRLLQEVGLNNELHEVHWLEGISINVYTFMVFNSCLRVTKGLAF